jgi:hypothetical protein
MKRTLSGTRNPYLLCVTVLLCLFGALPGELPIQIAPRPAAPQRCAAPTAPAAPETAGRVAIARTAVPAGGRSCDR